MQFGKTVKEVSHQKTSKINNDDFQSMQKQVIVLTESRPFK